MLQHHFANGTRSQDKCFWTRDPTKILVLLVKNVTRFSSLIRLNHIAVVKEKYQHGWPKGREQEDEKSLKVITLTLWTLLLHYAFNWLRAQFKPEKGFTSDWVTMLSLKTEPRNSQEKNLVITAYRVGYLPRKKERKKEWTNFVSSCNTQERKNSLKNDQESRAPGLLIGWLIIVAVIDLNESIRTIDDMSSIEKWICLFVCLFVGVFEKKKT
jgi:hypothetical protein